MDDYIAKPVNTAVLINKLAQAVSASVTHSRSLARPVAPKSNAGG
jgi:hypothetical protein